MLSRQLFQVCLMVDKWNTESNAGKLVHGVVGHTERMDAANAKVLFLESGGYPASGEACTWGVTITSKRWPSLLIKSSLALSCRELISPITVLPRM